MSEHATNPATETFVAHRNLLFTVAYEMLGSAADAEDVLQETWLRWVRVDLEHVRDRLAHFKCPRDFHFVEELPKTATGKIQRFKLRRPTPPPEVEVEADPSPVRGG